MGRIDEKMGAYVSVTPSKWREHAQWRRANKQWLKKSQQIAMMIIDCLEDRHITQKVLSDKICVKPQYISKILKGSENLTLETITKLEQALDIEIISIHSYQSQQKVTPQNYFELPKLSQAGDVVRDSLDYGVSRAYSYNFNLDSAA